MLHRDQLRLYASLTDSQRSAILSEPGLDIRDLSLEQHAAVVKVISTRDSKFPQKPDAQVTLKIASKQDGKQIHYTFSAATSAGGSPVTDSFTTPKYQELKPSEKPADKPKPADPAKPGQAAK